MARKIIKGDGGEGGRARVQAAGQIYPKPVVDAMAWAESIREEARLESEKLVSEATQEATRIRDQAREQGRKEARAEANALLVKARIEREKLIANAEPQLVGLGRRIAEKIIGRELEVNPDVIVDVVRQALQTVKQQREIIVRVNPGDLSALQGRRGDVIAALARAKDVDLRADPDIGAGGCVVESELGTIDAQLDTQLGVIERLLAGEGGG
jgi:type III secretion system HrpE/YscL family protein